MLNKTIHRILVFILFSPVFFACQKEQTVNTPVVVTASVDGIFNTSARIGGKVTSDGGSEVTERGIFWGTSTNPDTSGTKLQIGAGTGVYYDTLRNLSPGVKYYVKAFASNSGGVSYGNETSFTTQISLPTVTTSALSGLTPSSAVVGGVVVDDGGFEVIRGVYWGTFANPQTTGIKLEIGSGKGAFSQTLTGLSRSITYYVTAFATNIKGTAYGDEISFSTQSELPAVYTTIALDITAYSATIGGEVISSNGAEVTERGIYWGTLVNPQTSGTKVAIGNGLGTFSNALTELSPGITYYFKAFATNSIGTAYGTEYNFVTLGALPEATTMTQTNITTNSVTLMGLVNANDLSTVVTFEYGTTTSYGNSVTAGESPTTMNNDTLSANITGLTPETLYHFRVKAVNELGTVYGNDSIFTTVLTGITGTVNDADGNSYPTIGIGHQIWMTENLKTTRYNDGTSIFLADADTSWVKTNTPGYCWYSNDIDNKDIYGALYNFAAVSSNKLCPAGWHIPTNEDWTELVNFLGGASLAGGKLKEVGLSNWSSPNTGATDEYDFTALPGGKRLDNGIFDLSMVEGNWWSSSNYGEQNAWYLSLLCNYNNSFQGYINKKYGMSIRCVKD